MSDFDVDLSEDDFKVNTDKLVRMVAKYQGVGKGDARLIVQSWLTGTEHASPDEVRIRRCRQRSIVNGEVMRRRARWLHRNMAEHLASEGVGIAYRGPVEWKAGVRYGDDA